MEQKDYLLREIEKIGALFSLIFSKLLGKELKVALSVERQFEDEREMLLRDAGFDMELFLSLKEKEIQEYLAKFSGINTANMELLADIIKEMGMKSEPVSGKVCLKKALSLYELCNATDKTFSFERVDKMNEIKSAL
jgi:hypothetical protein